MRQLIKPMALQKGDTVAAVSLSSGSAGAFRNRYEQGKHQFEKAFDVKLVEMPHALDTPEEVYAHPENRLADLMAAFQNPDIKAILTNIGGDDTIRLLRLMTPEHFDIIRQNPKIFLGLSDTTVNHFMCLKAGIGSFYSACTMFGFAENGGIPEIMIQNTQRTLFSTEPLGVLPESDSFIAERINWSESTVRTRTPSTPWRYIQGDHPVRGRLIGGCIDVLDFINGTSLWPTVDEFKDSILFLETSEDMPTPAQVSYWLRTFGAQGILDNVRGILFARPGGEFVPADKDKQDAWIANHTDYDNMILKVLKEYDRADMPVVTNMDFGHTVPQLILPYGVLCEINPVKHTVSLLESGVR